MPLIKIIDFGLAKLLQRGGRARSVLGTCGYMAPEIVSRGEYDKPVDMWAFGVLAFLLVCGEFPFASTSVHDMLISIHESMEPRSRFLHLHFPRGVSESCRDFIHRCLVLDPSMRITAEETLEHSWIAGETCTARMLDSPQRLVAVRKYSSTLSRGHDHGDRSKPSSSSLRYSSEPRSTGREDAKGHQARSHVSAMR